MSAEATVVRNYLDWMIDLPWHKKSDVAIDLKKALEVLDKDHFGLEKVKERIIEFLAVQKRMEKIKGPILCLVGPPGVGKTSSISAEAYMFLLTLIVRILEPGLITIDLLIVAKFLSVLNVDLVNLTWVIVVRLIREV